MKRLKKKFVFDQQWIRTSILSRQFRVEGKCELCSKTTAGRVWYNITTGTIRCRICYKPSL